MRKNNIIRKNNSRMYMSDTDSSRQHISSNISHRLKRSRVRRRLLTRVGMLSCITIICVFVLSLWGGAIWRSYGHRYQIGAAYGRIIFMWRPDGWDSDAPRYPVEPGWRKIDIARNGPKADWWFFAGPSRSWMTLEVPAWVLLIAIGGPTVLVRACNRAFPVGHCQVCGYNLTGNISGVCPECADPVPKTSGTSL